VTATRPADDRRSAALRRPVEITAPGTHAAAGAIFVPVAIGIAAAALSGLPLFQDGGSYLFELLLTHSAIRHHRLSVALLQVPARAMMRLVSILGLDDSKALPLVRLAFDASYAMVPLVALGLSWLIVRRRRPDLLIWPALVILFVNLVNFSWVSELLIGIELCCPLLLSTVLLLGTRAHWVLTALLLPIVLLLHPLVAPLLLVIAVAAAYAGGHVRSAARWTCAVYVAAALLRIVMSLLSLTSYESGFTGGEEMRTYLFATSWQNAILLMSALAIAGSCWRAKALHGPQRRLAYRGSATIAIAAAILLVSQYLVGTGAFPLKTGLTLFVAIGILLIGMLDSGTAPSSDETRERMRLAAVLAIVFALVVVAKSLLWHNTVTRLLRTLAAARTSCVETIADEFTWVHRAPYTIVDTWALPSLALVLQDERPRRLLLESGDCARFFESGAVRVDPWTVLPAHVIVPRLD